MTSASRDAKTFYQEVILVHGRAPRHEGPLAGATHETTVKNPLCGDRITLRLRLDPDHRVVKGAAFEARGCMIAKASASLLAEAVVGLRRDDALALLPFVVQLVAAPAEPLLQPVTALAGPPASRARVLEPLAGARELPARRACVLLPWRALEDCLSARAGRLH